MASDTGRMTPPRCFNGAALFQVRKAHQIPNSGWKPYPASMGPHFFKCGKGRRRSWRLPRGSRFNGAALFQVRKANGFARLIFRAASASMGPHFFKCGKFIVVSFAAANRGRRFNGAALFQVRKVVQSPAVPPVSALLQWGRTFSSAERRNQTSIGIRPIRSFNGAALFQVRKAIVE